ncbi:sec-independent translocase [Streptomyces violascens]|uniref:Sec-independent protein translocase protein TatB n=1 Tax=Streptomyces violascens TaxID=67381 RepID=A0ABQ3QSA1_9ACTN|nr:sec-independent translocase [Streptomyces violascens]GGU48072.1 sec-independent protein translocase protein TatB [Streptomyces violascens]GHI40139.1 sec-independent protein translocase protein TatB [Streptomyces violascens]
MFTELGPMKLLTIAIVAMFVFGPEKLPEFIRNATGVLRRVRAFADSARQEVRSELGPEFKDFEFEDLHPKTFVRKHMLEGDGLAGLEEIRNALDPRPELEEVTAAVRDTGAGRAPGAVSLAKGAPANPSTRHVFDPDAT